MLLTCLKNEVAGNAPIGSSRPQFSNQIDNGAEYDERAFSAKGHDFWRGGLALAAAAIALLSIVIAAKACTPAFEINQCRHAAMMETMLP
jgi:hypothetical protein